MDDAVWEKLNGIFPNIGVSRTQFENYLATREADEDTTQDVFLACGCAAGSLAAITWVHSLYFADLRIALSKYAAHDASDLVQALDEKLFVSQDGSPPKIAEYAGRGPLKAWLRVVAVRLATSAARKRTESPVEHGLDKLPATDRGADPELVYLRSRYTGVFEEAFRAGSRQLSPEERNVLRYHYTDGLSIDQIGAIYGLHRVSAARRIRHARERLIEMTKDALRKSSFQSESELLSVLGAVESQIVLSVRSLLQ